MLQGYFYICDKFAHGPTEKDEVYVRGYVSRLIRDEMAVTFLETCSQEAGWVLGHTLNIWFRPAIPNATMHFPVSSGCTAYMAIPSSTLDQKFNHTLANYKLY